MKCPIPVQIILVQDDHTGEVGGLPIWTSTILRYLRKVRKYFYYLHLVASRKFAPRRHRYIVLTWEKGVN